MALPRSLPEDENPQFSPAASYGTLRSGDISCLQDLLDKIETYYSSADLSLVQKAFELASRAHKGQLRKDGSPYILHPLNVAALLADLHLDLYTVVTGLLHDVVEDTEWSVKDLEKEFNPTVAFLVDGVSKISHISFRNTHHKTSENMRKMIVAIAQDVRVLLVKLADRLHNMRTLKHLTPEKQLLTAQETLDIYAPLASRLGIYSLKVELEDLAFQYSDPETFSSLKRKMNEEKTQTEKYIKNVIAILKKEIRVKTHIPVEITGRLKNMYSIYKKMMSQNVDYDQVYDVLAFRICVHKMEECYQILGVLHSFYKPVPGRFKDYIAIPKTNNYQSLHSTVLGEQGRRIEVQIRTFDMHLLAEKGIAAHWKYKTESWREGSQVDKNTLKKFNWLQNLVSLHQHHSKSGEFLESVKMDLFDLEIYIFTPQGDVKEFPKGATPIDFAYAIHTDLGHKISGARVNGRLVPLKWKLKNGDTVEIITSKNQNPSEEWLKYCVTSKAKSKIKSFIRMERKKASLTIGQNLLEKELKSHKLKKEEVFKSPAWQKYAREKGLNSQEDLFSRLAYGKILISDLMANLVPAPPVQEKKLTSHGEVKKKDRPSSSAACPVSVEGSGNVMVHFAKCCKPLPGDLITGFISRGRGIMVHRHSCRTLLALDSERYVDVEWNESKEHKVWHPALVEVLVHDGPGVLSGLSGVFAEHNVNILNLNVKASQDLKSTCLFSVQLHNLKQLQEVLKSLKSLKPVISVKRS